MNDDRFGELVDDRPWPTPAAYTWQPQPSLWERFKLWLFGWQESDDE